jgi:hypothetical protein
MRDFFLCTGFSWGQGVTLSVSTRDEGPRQIIFVFMLSRLDVGFEGSTIVNTRKRISSSANRTAVTPAEAFVSPTRRISRSVRMNTASPQDL